MTETILFTAFVVFDGWQVNTNTPSAELTGGLVQKVAVPVKRLERWQAFVMSGVDGDTGGREVQDE